MPDYSKPKVTIDLDEYNHLKQIAEAEVDELSEVELYQRTLGNIFSKMPQAGRDHYFESMKKAGLSAILIPAFDRDADPICTLQRIIKDGIPTTSNALRP